MQKIENTFLRKLLENNSSLSERKGQGARRKITIAFLFTVTMNAFGALPKPNPVNDAWNILNLGSQEKCILEEMQPKYHLDVSLRVFTVTNLEVSNTLENFRVILWCWEIYVDK